MQQPIEIELRCFAEQKQRREWYVHCIDLGVDAVGASYVEARRKLDDAIILYIEWALENGVAPGAIKRRSRLSFRVRYWRAWIRNGVQRLLLRLFRRAVPAGAPDHQFVTHPALQPLPAKL